MGLREKVAEVIDAANGWYDNADTIADAVMGVVEGRLSELEAKAHEDYSDDPWDHGYLRAINDMRGGQ